MVDKKFEEKISKILSKSKDIEKVYIAGGNNYYSVSIIVNHVKAKNQKKIYNLELKVLDETDAAIDFHILDRDGRNISEFATFDEKFHRCIYEKETSKKS